MKNFAIFCIVAVVVLTLIAAVPQLSGTTAAMIGAAGFVALLLALSFYALADIRAIVREKANKVSP